MLSRAELGLSGMTGALFITLVMLSAYFIWKRQHAQQGYPPGPFTLPILGNLLQVVLAGDLEKFMNKYRKIYGRVFTVELGGYRRVVVSDFEVLSELLINKADITSNRSPEFHSPEWRKMLSESGAIVFSPYPNWKTLRTFALHYLREEGMGKSHIESRINEEIRAFCDRFIESSLGEPTTLQDKIMKATNNVTSIVVFGGRRDYDDPKLAEQMNAVRITMKLDTIASLTRTIPFSSYLSIHKTMYEQSWLLRHQFDEEFNTHKSKLDRNNCVDIYDHFLVKQEEELKSNNKLECFTDGNAQMMAYQLFLAGTDTTAAIITWAILYTCSHPEVLSKVKQEINSVIGHDKQPTYKDKLSMPYTDAVIHESMRLANILPGSLPHSLAKAFVIDEKVVPAGTDLLLNMSSVLHDGKVFEDPLQFNPDRYLTGDVKLKKQRTIPFSIGRRACLGEALARTEIFLFYVTLMQRYDIRFPDGQPKPSLEADAGFVSAPKPFNVIFSHG